jgi:hypothetical protein
MTVVRRDGQHRRRNRTRGAAQRPDAPAGPEQPEGQPAAAERTDSASTSGRRAARLAIVRLPAHIDRHTAADAVALVRVASSTGAAVVIADMSQTLSWDNGGLRVLLDAQRELPAEMRFVVWATDLYRALRDVAGGNGPRIYPNLPAALRAFPAPPRSGMWSGE